MDATEFENTTSKNKRTEFLWPDYLANQTWKCEVSPTKAHYWVNYCDILSKFRCRYCGQEKEMVVK